MTHLFVKIALAAAIIAAGAGAVHLLQRERPTVTIATPPTSRPSLDSLRLRGFGTTQDSLTLALQAAAGAFGQPAGYDMLYCLSGNAFAPAIDASEDCRSWWHVKASMGAQRIPQLAQAIGLRASVLARPMGQDDARYYREAAASIRDALSNGQIVLAEGGWDEVGAWDWAGIVTSVDDAGIRGVSLSAVTLEGKTEVPLRYARTLWALTPDGGATMSSRQMNRETLSVAVRRIRGQNEFQASGDRVYGLEAMDRWIAQMKEVRGFCAPCFSRSPVVGVQDAPDNDRRMFQAAKIASRHLIAMLDETPRDQRPWIQQASVCYDRIAQLLAPAIEGRFQYDSLATLDAQRQYARDVLEPIKTELTWAAVHMERALILADGGKLLPDAIAAYDPIARAYEDMNPIRSDLLMREVCLKSAGIPDVGYDDLVMLAGFGTTFAYHPKRYYYAYQPPSSPRDTEQRLCDGEGAAFERPAKAASAEDAWDLVKRTIDSGRPVQAGWLDDFVIAGYVDAPEKNQREIYAMGKWSIAGRMDWAQWSAWHERFGGLAFVSSQSSAREDLAAVILQRIVNWANRDDRRSLEFMREGQFSFEGMEAYAADIADMNKAPDYFDSAWQACHAVNRQWSSRQCASRWLERIVRSQPEAARERLQHAANAYARSYDLWRQFRLTLGGENAEAKWKNPQARKLGAELLREAIQVEKQAIEDISTAMPLISGLPQEQR